MTDLFGEKLKQLRQAKKLTQEQLAKELFVSRSAVAKWEQNRGFPNIETLQRISLVFDVSIDDLLSDKQIEIIKVFNTKKNILFQKINYNFINNSFDYHYSSIYFRDHISSKRISVLCR